jgi:hypothetical protein
METLYLETFKVIFVFGDFNCAADFSYGDKRPILERFNMVGRHCPSFKEKDAAMDMAYRLAG